MPSSDKRRVYISEMPQIDTAALARVKETLQKAMQPYQALIQSMSEQNDRLVAALKPLVENIDLCIKMFPKAVERICEAGWTFPSDMGFGTVAWFAEASDEEIDQAFVKFYEDNDTFVEVVAQIERRLHDETKKTTFAECIRAHELQMYIVAANTFIPLLEGELATFSDNPNCIWMKELCTKQLDQHKITLAFEWKTVKAFIDQLYEKNKFGDDEPTAINRHWQLHGRFSSQVTKTDCLRLLNAISTICELSDANKRFADEDKKNCDEQM